MFLSSYQRTYFLKTVFWKRIEQFFRVYIASSKHEGEWNNFRKLSTPSTTSRVYILPTLLVFICGYVNTRTKKYAVLPQDETREAKHFTAIATSLAIWLANLPLSIKNQTTLLASIFHIARVLKKTNFFEVDIAVKKQQQQLKSGQLAWFVLLSTTIRAITVVKICCELTPQSPTFCPLWRLVSLSITIQIRLNVTIFNLLK